MKLTVSVAAPMLAAAPTLALAQSAPTAAPRALSATDFVDQWAQTDKSELAAAQAAQSKHLDPAYEAYAKMIVADHTQMEEQLNSAAADLRAAAPNELDAQHATMLKQLQAADGAKFEQRYRSGQIAGRRQAIQLFHNYSRSGDNPQLKQLASAGLPKLQAHLSAAERLPRPTAAGAGVE